MSAVQKLIQKNLSRLEMDAHCRDKSRLPGRVSHHGVCYGPCLLVSRECGSLGVEIAQEAAKRLGWQVFDREIVEEIAHKAQVRKSLIQSVDERVRSNWEETWRTILMPDDLGNEDYFRYLRQVILAMGHHGEVVIIGRGAHYLLPPECALRLRVIAPLEIRTQNFAKQNDLSIKEAKQQLQSCCVERAKFIRTFYHSDINSPHDYDLVLNSSQFGLQQATDLVLAALRQKLGVTPPL